MILIGFSLFFVSNPSTNSWFVSITKSSFEAKQFKFIPPKQISLVPKLTEAKPQHARGTMPTDSIISHLQATILNAAISLTALW